MAKLKQKVIAKVKAGKTRSAHPVAAKNAAQQAPVKKVAKKTPAKTAPRPPAKASRKPSPTKAAQARRTAPAKPAPKAQAAAAAKAPARVSRVNGHEEKSFREMLVRARERLTRQVDALKVESLQRTEEIITSEDGTDAFDRQFALSIASSEQDAVYEIDDAIRRLDTGTYGVCEECGCAVEKLRLKALPFVRLCVKCQSAREKNRPHFRVWTPEG